MNLNLGQNTINIDVTSAIGGVTQRYTIIVTRVDTYLANAVIKMGKSTVDIGTFNMTTTSYSGTSPSTTVLTVTPTAHDPNNVTMTLITGTGENVITNGNNTTVAVTAHQVNNFSILVQSSINTAYSLTYNFAISVS